MPKRNAGVTAVEQSISIDPKKGWVFSSEDEVLSFFHETIEKLQEEFSTLHQDDDFDLDNFDNPEKCLEETLLDPDEIWEDEESCKGVKLSIFLKHFEVNETRFDYLAIAYLYEGRPTFVFTHFPTKVEEMASTYRRTIQIYSRDSSGGVQFVDALSGSDELAIGLYDAMLRLRSDVDIPEVEFSKYEDFRETVLNEPDEIWKGDDFNGKSIVKFIKEITFEDQTLHYIIVTAEEPETHSHYILFSFPTTDPNLLDRFRQGEKLDPGEFVKEESH